MTAYEALGSLRRDPRRRRRQARRRLQSGARPVGPGRVRAGDAAGGAAARRPPVAVHRDHAGGVQPRADPGADPATARRDVECVHSSAPASWHPFGKADQRSLFFPLNDWGGSAPKADQLMGMLHGSFADDGSQPVKDKALAGDLFNDPSDPDDPGAGLVAPWFADRARLDDRSGRRCCSPARRWSRAGARRAGSDERRAGAPAQTVAGAAADRRRRARAARAEAVERDLAGGDHARRRADADRLLPPLRRPPAAARRAARRARRRLRRGRARRGPRSTPPRTRPPRSARRCWS